ncbi:hypothetical protein QYF36_004051 [Acer negundo]|nr:hypothetical protein QYF36_004051 [Acer negundo]
MPRNETKPKSVRKPLRELSNNNNNNGAGKLSKSVNANKKCSEEASDDCALDRLLLVQSDLSALLQQIDELVVQAFKVKATNRQGSKEFESFARVLSDMLSTLKPWVPRFQNVLSSPVESENQLGQSLPSKAASNGEEKSEFGSPEELKEDTLVSPSPLVSWRANCTVERGRQLFLLTPLPMSKAFSSRHHGASKSVFERINCNQTVELPPLLTIPGDANDDLLEGVAIQPTPSKPSDSIAVGTKNTLESSVVTSPLLSKRNKSALKMSPPKSCVLLEPISESSHRFNDKVRKSTPYPVGIQNCRGSQFSESSGSEGSEDLAFKYPELLGIRQACKSGIVKKGLDASPDWLFSPPKSCVLLELLDEESSENAAVDCNLPITSGVLNTLNEKENDVQTGCHQIYTSCHPEPVRTNLALIESTPLCKEPESTFKMGQRPGENTLKKELWTRFEAASTYGIRYDASAHQKTAVKKGFLDMLEEASCDEEDSVLDGLR